MPPFETKTIQNQPLVYDASQNFLTQPTPAHRGHLGAVLLVFVFAMLGLAGVWLGARHELNKQLAQQNQLTGKVQKVESETKATSLKVTNLQTALGQLNAAQQTLALQQNTGPLGARGSPGPPGEQGPTGPSGTAGCANGSCVSLQGSSPGTQEAGSINVSGTVTAGSFSGDGSGLSLSPTVIVQSGNSLGSALVIGTNDSQDLKFETNDTARFKIQNNGDILLDDSTLFVDAANNRVGIGTTNPSADLTFGDGTARIINVQTRTTNAAGNKLTIQGGDAGAGASAADGGTLILQGGDAAGTTGIGSGGDVVIHGGAKVNTGPDGDVILAHDGTAAIGNVGVGTASPSFKLQVEGPGAAQGGVNYQLVIYDTSSFAVDEGGTLGLGGYVDATPTSRVFAAVKAGKENGTTGNSSGYLALFTRSGSSLGERLRISSAGNLTLNGHVISANSSGSTTVAVESAAGTGATASLAGNDTAGTVTITTGTSPTNGNLATVTFANAYGAAPRVVISAASSNGSSIRYYATSTTTTFTISSSNLPNASAVHTYNYVVVQ